MVSTSGVYKIAYSDLKNLGLKNPENIRIYGNGGKMLPEIYSGYVPDDLNEIPVLMMTGADGVFNDGDYIIFYAEGPVTWSYDRKTSTYIHQKHAFSDKVTYFITSQPGGKRITNADVPVGNANVQVNTFDGLAYHEENLYNLIQSGRAWYGEEFNVQSSYNFPFSFPNLITTEPVNLSTEVVGRTASGSAFKFLPK